MKPREMYSGAAPAAMGQMGAGLMEAGANIGRTLQSGYEAMGKGIASGISSVGQAYGQYKQAKTSNDITRSMINDPEYGKMLGLDPGSPDYENRKKQLLGTLDQTIKFHGQIGGAQFSKQFLQPIQEYHALGRQYEERLKVATALSGPDATLKAAQATEATARAAAFSRKANPAPMLDFTSGVNWNAPAQPVPAAGTTSNENLASGLFPSSTRKYDYENLSPQQQKYIDDSSFGKDYWNVLGEDQQAKFLPSLHLPNFGLKRSTR
jgi:hypothetical protein